MNDLRAPFPWFGGKSRCAAEVWRRFGTVQNYVEPFAGSLAVLLANPAPEPPIETANDMNGWLVNFWRALAADPDAVATHCDWPVSELDQQARGNALFYPETHWPGLYAPYGGLESWLTRLREEPEFYDARIAGWWVWGQSCWIGDNWGRGAHNAKRDAAGNAVAVVKSHPHLTHRGMGIHRQLPHLGNAGKGIHRQQASLPEYLAQLSQRLRRVRVCCGDWSRVCGRSVTTANGLTGVFLDPPYGAEDRADCYGAEESRTVAAEVRAWCLANGDNPQLRIALCGYDSEGHNELETHGWQVFAWKANGGYGSQKQNGTNANAHRERIWFSPACLHDSLFNL